VTVRADDVPARFGGAQVFLVLRRATEELPVESDTQLRRAAHTEGARGRRAEHRVGVVVGVTGMQSLVSRADAALCLAMRTDRDRVAVG
jgi:PleD family two-component response regulator